MFTRIRTALDGARARKDAHRAYERLLAADEHTLRDIGVGRADVRRAMRGQLPF